MSPASRDNSLPRIPVRIHHLSIVQEGSNRTCCCFGGNQLECAPSPHSPQSFVFTGPGPHCHPLHHPLVSLQGFVLTVTIIREAVEEIRCYVRDKEVNSHVYSRLTARGKVLDGQSGIEFKAWLGMAVWVFYSPRELGVRSPGTPESLVLEAEFGSWHQSGHWHPVLGLCLCVCVCVRAWLGHQSTLAVHLFLGYNWWDSGLTPVSAFRNNSWQTRATIWDARN